MAEATAQDLITSAFQDIAIYGAIEASSITDADNAYALTLLQDMMDSWSNENLSAFTILEQSVLLTIGKASYTIGLSGGADIALTRPLRIIDDPGSCYIQDANQNNYGVSVVTRDKWNLYSNRGPIVTSNFPNVLFYDPQMPLGVINLTPYPNASYTLFFDSYLQLNDFPALTTPINLPPGYNLAIRRSLAEELWPAFGQGEVPAPIMRMSRVAKGNVKRTNVRPSQVIFDQEIVSRGQIQYNPYTDSPGSVISGT